MEILDISGDVWEFEDTFSNNTADRNYSQLNVTSNAPEVLKSMFDFFLATKHVYGIRQTDFENSQCS